MTQARLYRCKPECGCSPCKVGETAMVACALPPATPTLPVAALTILRQRDMQAIGAAISNRNWHAVEVAYNEARDRLDRNILPAIKALGATV